MKRISFKAAKALKEVGYPQNYAFNVSVYDKEGKEVAIGDTDIPLNCDAILAPTYLEVWLWLWREKHIAVEADYSFANDDWFDGGICGSKFNDPEEAIVAAIEYMVDNNLIK